jgi:glycine cleavage system aminomethyltransferase T/glycine/D-amino acid oxidase-like deaminating enzyme
MQRVDQARVVVIGGGITGCSIALHLARAGWREIVLLDKGQLTSGSTSQAAGLVTMFNPSGTMMRFRRYSIELYRELGVFDTVGGLRIASSREQLLELQRGASRARGIGLDVDLVGPDESRRLMPAITPDSLFGGLWVPGDGFLDPHMTTHAVAAAARDLGVTIRTGVRVTGIELSARREVTTVLTDQGPIRTETVVNAAGMWAPRIAAMVGSFIPSTPVDHQHIALKAVPGFELPRDMPCFRDPDNLVYGKAEAGGMLFGGYEPEPRARWVDGVPWEHGSRSLPPDWDRFQPLLEGAIRRFPFLADAEAVRLICHPDAMTPDANPLLGPMPGLHGFWVAAGLSLNGFGGAGGIGRVMAEWITAGDPDLDVHPYRAWRFGDPYRDPGYAAATAREAYRYYYRLRYPYDADVEGRPRRLSALHGRLGERGAVFGTKHAWERPDHFEPGSPPRRAGEDQRAYGWTTPPWFGRVAEEHRAVRERAGLIDLSSFGKLAVSGPGARSLLQRVAANDVDRPVGSVVYTPFLDARGGFLADVTITRLAEERFRVVTGAGYAAGDLGWLQANVVDGDPEVRLADESDAVACLALWGPRARDVLGAATNDDVTDGAIPLRTARTIRLGPAPVLAQRISYAGELGWELYVDREWAVQAWDRLVESGRSHGLAFVGYRALDALRMEKGYRYYGTDLTMLDTPVEAGMLAFVRFGKGGFIGRDALLAHREAPPASRLRTVLVGEDAAYRPVYGGEAVRHEGDVVGRLRSAAYGFTVNRTIGYVYLPPNLVEGSRLEVDVFDERVPAVVAADAVVDPPGHRMRG